MKRLLLISTHIGAGGARLCHHLTQQRFHWIQETVVYDHPIKVKLIEEIEHKYDNNGMYVMELLFNHQICNKRVYDFCHVVHLVREPTCLSTNKPEIMASLASYYIHRLRRIYEVVKHNQGQIVLTWDDLRTGRGVELLNNQFKIDLKFSAEEQRYNLLPLPKPLLHQTQAAYERFIYRINNCECVLKC